MIPMGTVASIDFTYWRLPMLTIARWKGRHCWRETLMGVLGIGERRELFGDAADILSKGGSCWCLCLTDCMLSSSLTVKGTLNKLRALLFFYLLNDCGGGH